LQREILAKGESGMNELEKSDKMRRQIKMSGALNFYRRFNVVPHLELSTRTANALLNHREIGSSPTLESLFDIDMATDAMMLSVLPNFGRKSLNELRYEVQVFKERYHIFEPISLKEIIFTMKLLIQSVGINDADQIWTSTKAQLANERSRGSL
jgi:hypothetical protein